MIVHVPEGALNDMTFLAGQEHPLSSVEEVCGTSPHGKVGIHASHTNTKDCQIQPMVQGAGATGAISDSKSAFFLFGDEYIKEA